MMIVDYRTWPLPVAGRLWDADGVEIGGAIQRFDTETGECLHLIRDGESFKLNEAGDDIVKETRVHKAPLTFVPDVQHG